MLYAHALMEGKLLRKVTTFTVTSNSKTILNFCFECSHNLIFLYFDFKIIVRRLH